MYPILTLVLAIQAKNAVEELISPYLPWRTVLNEDPRFEKASQCVLPPYSEIGDYVVINKPNAKPGDRFQNVSIVVHELILHSTGFLKDFLRFKTLSCSKGEWRESLFQYSSEKLYFNTSWCPVTCPMTTANSVTAPPSSSLSNAYQIELENLDDRDKNLCKLPPYPARGGYYLKYNTQRMAKPGDFFPSVDLIQYKLVNGHDDLYEVSHLECTSGKWKLKLFTDTEVLFEQQVYCSRLCSVYTTKKSLEPRAKQLRKNSWSLKQSNEHPKCVLPPYSGNSNYTVANKPEAKPGEAFKAVLLKYYCNFNDEIVGNKNVFCIDGVWSDVAPSCKYGPV